MRRHAMTAPSRVSDLLAVHGWEAAGKTVPEGDALRTPVELPAGIEALLYVWDDETLARRAARVHELVGPVLFAVPEAIDSGPGWLVVGRPAGRPATQLFPSDPAARDLALLEPMRARGLVESLGNALRKLHSFPAQSVCGDILDEPGDAPRRWLTFSGWVAHHLEWFASDLRRRDFDDDTASHLAKSIADMRHELSAFHPRTPPSFCHGKLSLRHVWVDTAGREVVGLTGFDHAAWLPREADLAQLLWIEGLGAEETASRALYQGYGAARTMDVQRRERFFRRLVAFEALVGLKGEVLRTPRELIELSSG